MTDTKLIEGLGSVVTELLLAHGDGVYEDGLAHAAIVTEAIQSLSAQPGPVGARTLHDASGKRYSEDALAAAEYYYQNPSMALIAWDKQMKPAPELAAADGGGSLDEWPSYERKTMEDAKECGARIYPQTPTGFPVLITFTPKQLALFATMQNVKPVADAEKFEVLLCALVAGVCKAFTKEGGYDYADECEALRSFFKSSRSAQVGMVSVEPLVLEAALQALRRVLPQTRGILVVQDIEYAISKLESASTTHGGER